MESRIVDSTEEKSIFTLTWYLFLSAGHPNSLRLTDVSTPIRCSSKKEVEPEDYWHAKNISKLSMACGYQEYQKHINVCPISSTNLKEHSETVPKVQKLRGKPTGNCKIDTDEGNSCLYWPAILPVT